MKKTLCILLWVFMLYGCAAQPIGLAKIEPQEAEILIETLSPALESDTSETQMLPISVEPIILFKEESKILLPKVSNCSAQERINDTLEQEITDFINSIHEPVWSEYSIKTNSNGVFSLLVQVSSLKNGNQLEVLPLTFNSSTGEICNLAGYFESEADRWRYVLPDIVEAQAKRRGITLLSDLLPTKDDQSYYIFDDSGESKLVLLFHPYEITTFAAGTPQFFIPISDLAELFSSGSALLRFL